ncbi:MAG: SUMF1/EgtB/PvdO family nonheme iron enzyme [Phycisphaerae bacterium]|nr:SUMF1/EgtB/PvdO family nonheme iron enzyme [Phycisphaerae bacterium]
MKYRLLVLILVVFASSQGLLAKQLAVSPVVRSSDGPKKLTADLTGVKNLYLIVTDADDGNSQDHGFWGHPVLTDKDGNTVSLTTLKPKSLKVGWDTLHINEDYQGNTLQSGNMTFDQGLWTHGPAMLEYAIRGKYKKLETFVAVQKGNSGTVKFIIADQPPVSGPDIIPEPAAIKRAIDDLIIRFGEQYPDGQKYLDQLIQIESMPDSDDKVNALVELQHTALLANPLLKKFDSILVVKRSYGNNARTVINTCVPSLNAYSLEVINPKSGNDEIITLTDFDQPVLSTLYKPDMGGHIAEIDLDFDANKIMYSGLGSEDHWHLHEIDDNGKYVKQLTPEGAPYNSFDSCYLPDGRIIFTSTAPIQGLPCEAGRVQMSNTYLMDTNGGIRRLTFDQDANWGPTVTSDGRIMFIRWEYSDTPHFFTRVVMKMNPDGTNQDHFYGSNSYWPNTISTPKPIPGNVSQFIGVVSGHHVSRPGPLCIFDVSKGRFEAKGALQLIPGWKKEVVPEIADRLYQNFYPKFQNPIPLGTNEADGAGKYFLVSCKPSKNSLWGIYLVDIYDNIVKIAEQEGYALNEPVPFTKTEKPPIMPDRVDLTKKDATIYIADIYTGPGLKNIPKGTVKKLRVFTYHYSFYKSGSHEAVGCESSWDVKRILGTVPVQPDGSVMFKVPANTPIAIQPLDHTGASLQLMRSWFTAMPGEMLSCIGCHEDRSQVVPSRMTPMANKKGPSQIEDWQGPERNFSFLREIQPILQKNCIACHNSQTDKKLADGKALPDFADLTMEPLIYNDGLKDAPGGPFTHSYNALNPYVRRPGPESDYHLLQPMEYYVNTSPLIHILDRGHHGVKLSKDETEKLYAWIDMNAPFWGSWTDVHRDWANNLHRNWSGSGKTREDQLANIQKYRKLRLELQNSYANVQCDYEADVYSLDDAKIELAKIEPIMPKETEMVEKTVKFATKVKTETQTIKVDIPGGPLEFVQIPTGMFIVNSDQGRIVKKIDRRFYMATLEITNAQFKQFDPDHSSAYIDTLGKDHSIPGIDVRGDDLPVIRVSFDQAKQYAKWLSKQTGKKFSLPNESQWEFAARAGTTTDFYWGDVTADFGKYANLADQTMKKFNARQTFNYMLREDSVNDNAQVQIVGGKYQPNAFGLYDMIGNVAEWTKADGPNQVNAIAKGGSWRDLPRWITVDKSIPYQRVQKVYNVGIRLIMESE